MTDEVTPQTQQSAPKKDEKRPNNANNQQGGGGQRAPKKNPSRSVSTSGNAGPPRPSSGAGNRRNVSNPPGNNDSNAESRKGNNDNARRFDRGGRPQGNGAGRGGGGRKSSQSSRQGNRDSVSRQNSNKQSSSSPAPTATALAPTSSEGGTDALSAIQRAIADLKTSTPSNAPPANASIPASQSVSNLPANAPIFQPGAASYPGIAANEAPRHRKAASLGAGSLANNYSNFQPGFGSMMEDVIEEGPGGASYEEGEIPDNNFQTGLQQRRSLSQSFTAPRFAALAAQHDQPDSVGPSGRPQLAPSFVFGARRRPSNHLSMGPPISEEDANFQFPQQHVPQDFNINAPSEPTHRKTESQGEISGIMAEQVSYIYDSIHFISMLIMTADRDPEPD